jgi:hypothetical protein
MIISISQKALPHPIKGEELRLDGNVYFSERTPILLQVAKNGK